MPPRKRLCWCCEHKKTLHPMEAKPGTEGNQREKFQMKDGDTSESQGFGEHSLTHIEEALMWMNKRAEDRAERGVLGTMNK